MFEYKFVSGSLEEVSTRCKNQYLLFDTALRKQKNWALECKILF